jgi:FtsZ-binding cell division protein ZapB
MSDALIGSLQKRIDELTGENATLKSEAKDRRIAGKKLKEQLDALQKEHEKAVQERDGFKAKAEAAPGEKDAEIGRLQGEIRTRDHKDAFAGVKELKIKAKDEKGQDIEDTYTFNDGVKVEDVWGKAGYAPEGDVPDAAKITELYGKAREAAPYLFAKKAADAATHGSGDPTNPGRTSAVRQGPGAGRGIDTTMSAETAVSASHGNRPFGRL